MRSQWKTPDKLVVGILVTVLVGTWTLFFTQSAGASAEAAAPGVTTNCAMTVASHVGLRSDSELNGIIDPETEILTVVYRDHDSEHDRSFDVALGDRSCAAVKGLGKFIETAEQDWVEAHAENCSSLRQIERDSVTEVRGQRINQNALRAHLDKWCT